MVDRPLRARHVLGDELPLPGPPDGVDEGVVVALVEAEHQRVEVRRGPDAEEGEAGAGVFGGEEADGGAEGRGGDAGVLEDGGQDDGVDSAAEVEVEVFRVAVGFLVDEDGAGDLLEAGGANHAFFEHWICGFLSA